MTAVAVIELPSIRWNPTDGWNRLVAKLREERGIGLVELLIALLVLNIGIFATLAAFTSGALAIRRASHISTATAIADQEVEVLRNTAYPNIASQAATLWPAAKTPDGRQYTVQVAVSTGSQLTSGTYQGSAKVKVATVTVRDVADGNKVLVTSSSTYSECTQSGVGTDTNTTPCQS